VDITSPSSWSASVTAPAGPSTKRAWILRQDSTKRARIAGRERTDVESLDSFGALFEPGFRVPPATPFLHGAGIFLATEPGAQFFSPALSEKQ
jgi:hypothetical protein